MPLSLKERRGLYLGAESNAGLVVDKEMRIVDILEEESDMAKIKVGSGGSGWDSLSSPRLMLSRLLASIRPSKESNKRRYRLISETASYWKNNDVGTEDELQRISEKNTTVVGSLAQVAPENEEGGLKLEGVEPEQRKFQTGSYWKSSRPSCSKVAELESQCLSGSVGEIKDEVPSTSEPSVEGTTPMSKYAKESKSSSMDSTSVCSKSTQTVLPSGRCLEETLNFGLAIGFVSLIANSKDELDKMRELRTQMEILLKDIRSEMQKKDMISYSFNRDSSLGYSATDLLGIESTTNNAVMRKHRLSENILQEESAMECSQGLELDSTCTNNAGRDKLEAELEAELERLQLNLDAENLEVQQHQRLEMATQKSIPSGSFQIFKEEEEVHNSDTKECTGVSPNALERRLHELLQSRQQERIEELEIALQYAEQKLQEKDMEIQWWKDTVQLLLQHKQEDTCFPESPNA